MAQILITEFMDQPAVDWLAETHSVTYDPSLVDSPADIQARIGEVDCLIVRNRTQVTDKLVASAPRLTTVGRLGVGLDNIDLQACQKQNVRVIPATGANAVAVAEYVISAALVLRRGVFALNAAMLGGEWPRTTSIGRELSGATLGIMGYGLIGREVAKRAAAFDMDIVAHDPYQENFDGAKSVSSEALLDTSDIVSLHIPQLPETTNLISKTTLATMKPDAILINSARGGVVDALAVAQALRSGQLGGAALDVFSEEPMSEKSAEQFADVPNLILTPHIAGLTTEANDRTAWMIARAVHDQLK